MESTTIHRTIADARAEIDGDYSSSARAIDSLLDLRLLADESTNLVVLIDSALAEVPGRFVVPNLWWNEQLDQIERLTLAEEQQLAANGLD